MDEPILVRVRARDVRPYHYALWSSVMGGAPYANVICHVRWSEDGRHLWFGLDSHNTHRAEPDDEIELVDLTGDPSWSSSQARYSDWTLPARPVVADNLASADEIERLTGLVVEATVAAATAQRERDEARAELARRDALPALVVAPAPHDVGAASPPSNDPAGSLDDWRAALVAAGLTRRRASPRRYACWVRGKSRVFGENLYGWKLSGRGGVYPTEEAAARAWLAGREVSRG